METEIWKDVVGYNGSYKISNLGNLKSVYYNNTKEEKLLKFYKRKKGYLSINLQKKCCLIHRLVAQAFIPNPENKPQINHINGIKTDNRVENLEWNTAKENVIHSFKNGLQVIGKGKDNLKSKKVIQYTLNGEKIKIWNGVSDITRKLGFNQGNISSCARGERNTAHGFIWKYVVLD